ncbi:hypothetical protein ES332_A06G074100v1 [Gossypium tomentosum]|uniref:Uncharacterized protein n=1 Tax=Gossypium tomentosum TaxID=34277 RepID=A0A5D2Q0N6_GOSTO|nr:hypothetical protein ES332_A06G074100v1 [Gossypium tomentosum]
MKIAITTNYLNILYSIYLSIFIRFINHFSRKKKNSTAKRASIDTASSSSSFLQKKLQTKPLNFKPIATKLME